MDVLADGVWENIFEEKPPVFTREEKRAWLAICQMAHWSPCLLILLFPIKRIIAERWRWRAVPISR